LKNKFLKYTGLRFLFTRAKRIYGFVKAKVNRSLRVQLVLTFAVCSIALGIVSSLAVEMFGQLDQSATITYEYGMNNIDNTARNLTDEIESREETIMRNEERARDNETGEVGTEYVRTMPEIIRGYENRSDDIKILIADSEGKVFQRSRNATEEKVDLHSVIRKAMEVRTGQYVRNRQEFYTIYPITTDGKSSYLIVSGIPYASIKYSPDGGFFTTMTGVAAFLGLFYFLTRRKMRKIQDLSAGLLEISTGNLDHRVDDAGEDELASLARNINHMAEELKTKIEEERQAERTKNELITNVSHDLRTPLTSIMGYLRLLKDGRYEDEQKRNEYVQVAFNKSEQLKVLLEDLFEYTKISGDGNKLRKERVNLGELLDQLTEEWLATAEESNIVLRKDLPQERVNVYIDPDKMVRVFENLFSNAIKYSHKPGVVRVKMNAEDASVIVCVENKGEPIPPEQLSRLFERFYKVDQSRSSNSEGSGLGLAIAKGIVDLHGGEIWAETDGEQIRFKLKLNRA